MTYRCKDLIFTSTEPHHLREALKKAKGFALDPRFIGDFIAKANELIGKSTSSKTVELLEDLIDEIKVLDPVLSTKEAIAIDRAIKSIPVGKSELLEEQVPSRESLLARVPALDNIEYGFGKNSILEAMIDDHYICEIDKPSALNNTREAEKELILKTLRAFEWNRTEAAKSLGISIRTLRNKINLYLQEFEDIDCAYRPESLSSYSVDCNE